MNKLVISNFYNNILLGFSFVKDKLERIYDFNSDNIVGNVYCGYVENIVKNINAAFVNITPDEKGYLPLENKHIKSGDKILVQVKSDKVKTKDYLLTTDISFNSKDLVLITDSTNINISKKINNEDFIVSCKEMLSSLCDNVGFIVRTSAVNISLEELKHQAIVLIEQYKCCIEKNKFAKGKTLIFENDYIVNECQQFCYKYDGQIITDSQIVFEKLKNKVNLIFENNNNISLENKFALHTLLKKATDKKVWVKSGGYIIIEPTEALTVIDVNSGKVDTGNNRNNTFKKINNEAGKEILSQLKIRNISGIIIVDFINMDYKEDYLELEEYLTKLAMEDYTQCNIVGFTKLGLLEITRKKGQKPLSEIISTK